ncbi:MAG: PHP-associated domain-containing protein [Dehalococcoidia bacterium]
MTSPPEFPPRYGRADLQVHTSQGDGMDDALTIFERVERDALLDVIAVTDHDDVAGALHAREVYEAHRDRWHFDLVTGIEVTTTHGHLLALWVDGPVRSFRSLEATIAEVHEAGGVAVVPHPFSMLTRSIGRRTLDRVMALEDATARPDGLEVANTLSKGWHAGDRARAANRVRWGLAETGGSDAHFVQAVGRAYTRFPTAAGTAERGADADAVRRAILERRTEGVLTGATPYREIGLRRLAAQQVRGLSVTPRKVLGPIVGAGVRGLRAHGASRRPR